MAYTKQQILDDIVNPALVSNIGSALQTTLVSEPLAINYANFTYIHTTSTFSGWGWAIGVMKNFNQVSFKIKAREDITLIKTVIKTTNKSGTIVASKDVVVNILNGNESVVTVLFDDIISNTSNDQLYFMFAANGSISEWATSYAADKPYPVPPYGGQSYTVNGSTNFSIFSDNAANQFLYTRIERVDNTGVAPNTIFSEKVAAASTTIQQNKSDITFTKPFAEIILPSRIFAIEGKETNIYFANIVSSNLRTSQLDFDITCTKGIQYEKFWRTTPVAADAGSYSFKVDVYFNKVIIATYTSTLYIVAIGAASGVSRSVIGVGDSTLSGGQPLSTLISENSSDVMTVTFKGTQGTGSNKHEGRSGWKIQYFATVGVTFYKYVVSGITTPPAIGAVYSDGTNSFTVREVNITSGSGYISADKLSGAGTSPASGTLTNVSGIGDATITYSSWSTTAGNPFWNNSTSQLDFSNYLTTNSITMASSDWVFIHLGINDVFGYTDDATLATQISTMVTQLRALITNMRSAVAGLRTALCITIMPTISQDGFGANYTTGQTLMRYLQNIKTWQKRMITEFDNDTERTAGNYLIAWNAVIDRENNMQKSSVDANARNTTQITTYTNGVHPAQSGYDQMGDELWAFLKYMA